MRSKIIPKNLAVASPRFLPSLIELMVLLAIAAFLGSALLPAASAGRRVSPSQNMPGVLHALTGGLYSYTLTVNSGSGDGYYPVGTVVPVHADTPSTGSAFSHWSGSVWAMDDVNSADTTVTMPERDISVTANYEILPGHYTLTINSGSGDGAYQTGSQVPITADTPAPGKIFDKWTGDTAAIANVHSASTTIIMPAGNVTVTATYSNLLYTLTVNSGSGDGQFAMNTVAAIVADTAPAGQGFDKWIGDTGTVASIHSSNTTVTMPAASIALTATYGPVYTLAVVSGSGDGEYVPGETIAILADPSPGEMFDRWIGDTSFVANVGSRSTTVTMPAHSVTVSATYKTSVSAPVFTNVSATNFPDVRRGLGNTLIDLDHDGDLDLIETSAGFAGNLVFLNDGTGVFTQAPNNAGIPTNGEGFSAIVGDYDNDGLTDLAIGWFWVGGSKLYRQDSPLHFTDVSASSGILNPNSITGGAFVDVNGDGWLDLSFATDGRQRLYINDGHGRFGYTGDSIFGHGTTTLFADIDHDGDPDLLMTASADAYSSNPAGYAMVRINNGHGGFSDPTPPSGVVNTATEVVILGDINNDGVLDLYQSCGRLYRGNPGGTFTEITADSGISTDPCQICAWADVNNDGWLDLFAAGHLWMNNGDITFTDGTSAAGLSAVVDGQWSIAFGDIDGDGDLDLRGYETAIALFRNDTPATPYLIVHPVHTYGSTALNAKVWIYEAGHISDPAYLLRYQEVLGGTGRIGGPMPYAHFGLPGRTHVDVKVWFPGGAVASLSNVACDQLLVVQEPVPYTLTVNSGSGDGEYTAGELVSIFAEAAPLGKEFDTWTGDTAAVANVLSASTTFTMPASDVTVTATFIDVIYTLVVNSGSGDGQYIMDDIVPISADNAPTGLMFDRWTGDTGVVANIQSSDTTVTMPAADVALMATYKPIPISLTLTVISGSGSGVYFEDDVVGITADTAPVDHVFDRWVGDTVTVADVYAQSTTVTIPAADVTLTATYQPLYTLTVTSGSGDGQYLAGELVSISAEAAPLGKQFDKWTGDTAAVATVHSAGTTITMPDGNATVTATYSNVLYTLTVNSGSGDGQYAMGTVVAIDADTAPAGQMFDRWTGDTGAVANINSSSTTVSMPAAGVTLMATCKPIPPSNILTVINGSGSGVYYEDDVVDITANAAPVDNVFHRWVGDTATVANVYAQSTAVTITAANITLTATYQPLYTLTVTSGSGDGSYTENTVVPIAANSLTGRTFERWTGDTATVANIHSSTTTVTMPGADVHLTATYQSVINILHPSVGATLERNGNSFIAWSAPTLDAKTPLLIELINSTGDSWVLAENVKAAKGILKWTVGKWKSNIGQRVYINGDDYRIRIVTPGGSVIATGRVFAIGSVTSLEILGPDTVDENSTTPYTCMAHFDFGDPQDYTRAKIKWSTSSKSAKVKLGVLTAGKVSDDTTCTLTAGYGKKTNYCSGNCGITIRNRN